MKKLGFRMTVFICLISLVACSGNDGNSVDSLGGENEEITFRFAWWGGDSRAEATLAVIDLYMEQNPHINIIAQPQDFSGYKTAIGTHIIGGTEAELMQVDYNWIWSLSPDGDTFLDLNEWSNYIEFSNYDQDMLDQLTINNQLQAIPASITASVFILNKTLYDKAGLDIPTTWEEMLEASSTINENLGEGYFGMMDTGTIHLMFSYLEAVTGKEYLAENGQLNYTLEEIENGFQFIVDMIDNKVIPAGGVDSDKPDEINNKWINGEYGSVFIWDSTITSYTETVKEDQELIIAPYFDFGEKSGSGVRRRPSHGFAISKNAECPEEVAKFLEFMTTDPEAVKILNTERGIPANEVGYEILVENGLITELSSQARELHSNVGDSTIIHPFIEHALVFDIFETIKEELLYGLLTPKEAAERVYKELPGALEEAMR